MLNNPGALLSQVVLPPASTVSGLPRFTLLPGVSCIISNNDSVDRASHSKINPPTYRENNIRFGSRIVKSFPSVLSSATAALDQRSRPRRCPCPSSAGRMYHLACFVIHGVCLYLCFKKGQLFHTSGSGATSTTKFLSHTACLFNVQNPVPPAMLPSVNRVQITTVPSDWPFSIFYVASL